MIRCKSDSVNVAIRAALIRLTGTLKPWPDLSLEIERVVTVPRMPIASAAGRASHNSRLNNVGPRHLPPATSPSRIHTTAGLATALSDWCPSTGPALHRHLGDAPERQEGGRYGCGRGRPCLQHFAGSRARDGAFFAGIIARVASTGQTDRKCRTGRCRFRGGSAGTSGVHRCASPVDGPELHIERDRVTTRWVPVGRSGQSVTLFAVSGRWTRDSA